MQLDDFNKKHLDSKSGKGGFTLIEMIVSIALFAVVMTVAVGALLSLTGANKKAQALQSVMNNLNISVDSMVRNIRMGRDYECVGGTSTGTDTDTADCPSGRTEILFACNSEIQSCANASSQRWGYKFGGDCAAGRLCKSTDEGDEWTPITAKEVNIQEVRFYVVGTEPGDVVQPKVIIVIKGTAGVGRAETTFHIQATAVQRELDL